MLALSRKEGQQIYISDDICITVTSIRGNRVTLGIEAPRSHSIRRGELAPHATPAQPATSVTVDASAVQSLMAGC